MVVKCYIAIVNKKVFRECIIELKILIIIRLSVEAGFCLLFVFYGNLPVEGAHPNMQCLLMVKVYCAFYNIYWQ